MSQQAFTNNSAPVSLRGLFVDSDDDDESDDHTSNLAGGGDSSTSGRSGGGGGFRQEYEVQEKMIVDASIKIRQFSWHPANANQVWAGAFDLCAFISKNREKYLSEVQLHDKVENGGNIGGGAGSSCVILELGAATGAAAIYLSRPPAAFRVITSDIDDGGEVEENIKFNFQLNGIVSPLHVPFTWGQDWDAALNKAAALKYRSESSNCSNNSNYSSCNSDGNSSKDIAEKSVGSSVFKLVDNSNSSSSSSVDNSDKSLVGDESSPSTLNLNIKFIIASDILIYVSAYQHLADSLLFLFKKYKVVEFVLSHKRRIADGKIFFDMMLAAGFTCERQSPETCIYIFRLPS